MSGTCRVLSNLRFTAVDYILILNDYLITGSIEQITFSHHLPKWS